MLTAALDHGPECSEEGQTRNTELIRPQRPDAGLVDERLADIQAYPAILGQPFGLLN